MIFQGDLGYANNIFHSCYLSAPDFFADRFRRLLAARDFADLRARIATGFTIDDHDYGPRNNADRTTAAAWAAPLWNRIHADPAPSGLFRLPLRRRPLPHARRAPLRRSGGHAQHAGEDADRPCPVRLDAGDPRDERRAPLRHLQRGHLRVALARERLLARRLAERVRPRDAPVPRRAAARRARAHPERRRPRHAHPPPSLPEPDPAATARASSSSSARACARASGREPQLPDPTLDKRRNVLGRYGGGLVDVDAPAAPERRITLRAVSGNIGRPGDLFPPLVLPFEPVLTRGIARRSSGLAPRSPARCARRCRRASGP